MELQTLCLWSVLVFNLFARRRPLRNLAQPALERLEDRTLLSSVIRTDSGFGTDGQLNVPTAVDAVVQNSGRILTVQPAAIDATHNSVVIQGFDGNGAVDTSYGTNGKTVFLAPSTSSTATAQLLELRANGGAYVVGQTQLSSETGTRFFVASVDSAGKLDSSFGFQGRVTFLANDQDRIFDATTDAAGRLLLLRQDATTGGYYVQRFRTNGTQDTSFGPQGKSTLIVDFLIPTDILVHSNGTILVSAHTGEFGQTLYVQTVAANNTGTLPISINFGVQTITNGKLAEDSQGRLLVAAQGESTFSTSTVTGATTTTSALTIRRFSPSFLADTTFSYDQNTTGAAVGLSTKLGDIAVATDGKVLVSLSQTSIQPAGSIPELLRLNVDGIPDVTFDDDGFFTPTINGRPSGPLQLLPLQDGRLLTMTPMQRPSVLLPASILFQRYFVGTTPPSGRAEDIYTFDPTNGRLSVQISRNGSFVEQTVGNWGADPAWDTVTGDFDGDAKLDFAGRNSAGRWLVYLAGSGQTTDWGNWNKDFSWQRVTVADFNGDGLDDIIGQIPANAQLKNPDGTLRKVVTGGDWWVALSNGTSFKNEFFGRWQPEGWIDFEFADFTGDGRADVVGLLESGSWILGISNGAHFNIRFRGSWAAAPAWQSIVSGDFDGDGVAEVAGMTTNGNWWLGEFGNNLRVQTTFMTKWDNTNLSAQVRTGDFNGDGRTDVIGVDNNGAWLMLQGQGSGYQTVTGLGSVPPGGFAKAAIGDFNGDGRDDIATFTPSNGRFYTAMNQGSFFQQSLIGTINGLKASTVVSAGEIRS